MIEQGRHLNELVESAALSEREEKRQLIASASMLLTDRDMDAKEKKYFKRNLLPRNLTKN